MSTRSVTSIFVLATMLSIQSASAVGILANISKAPSYGTNEASAIFDRNVNGEKDAAGKVLLGSILAPLTVVTGIAATASGTSEALMGKQLRRFANDPAVKELVAFVGGREAECGEKYRLAARAISNYRQKGNMPSVTSDLTVAKELLKDAFSSAAQ
ncbi:MAG: hypothetical protein A2603_12910 [Bdellovibrionales bacterium RIFOXYD1_FULL_55_31]|nr:MAG: hypothetical protein A2603_12910 [Bdellovibrionales bacterium RIFOXYD1_FULL_55_31]